MLLMLSAFAFEEVCAEIPPGPPKGARQIAASALPTIHGYRQQVVAEEKVELGPEVQKWLFNDLAAPTEQPLAVEVEAVTDAAGKGWMLVELRAPRREALLPVNITAVVDVATSMESVVTRDLPVLDNIGPAYEFPPATKLQLTEALLLDLIERLPPESKLSILAIDGRNSRVILQPTDDRVKMHRHVERLSPKIVADFDPPVDETLEMLRTGTFEACGDNRTLIFTGSNDPTRRKRLEGHVKGWAADGVEGWTFAVGSYEPLNLANLDRKDRTASWTLNSISDGQVAWPALFDAGGVVTRSVKVQIGDKTVEVGDLESGQRWSSLIALSAEQLQSTTVRVTAGEWSKQLEITEVGKVSGSSAAMRTRVALQSSETAFLPRRGQGAEVGAWLRPHLDKREKPAVIVDDLSIEPYGDGFDLVATLTMNDRLELGEIRMLGVDALPAAHATQGKQAQVLWHLEAPVQAVQLKGGGLATSEVIVPRQQARRSDEVRFLDARRRNDPWVPSENPPHPRLAMLLAKAALEDGDADRVMELTTRCFEDVDPEIALGCGWARGSVLYDRQENEAAVVALEPSTLRSRADTSLAILMGRLTTRLEDWESAEKWYLLSLREGDDDGEAARELGPILLEQEMYAMAAVLFAHRVLLHPEDHDTRRELEILLDMKRWKPSPSSRGRLAKMQPNGGNKRIKKLQQLFHDWSQARRYELRIPDTPQHRDPWYQWMTDPFDNVVRYKLSETGAIWILFDRKEVPERYNRTFDMLERLLEVDD